MLVTLLVFLCLPPVLPIVHAADKPKTVLILISGATIDDLAPGGRLSELRKLAGVGGVALLHNGVWGNYTQHAAYLSVGASERMAAPVSIYFPMERLAEYQPRVADRARKVGAFGRVLRGAGVQVRGFGDGRAGLVAWDGASEKPFPYFGEKRPGGDSYDLYVDVVPDSRLDSGGANRYFRNIAAKKLYGNRTVYVVAPDTPEVANGAPYRRLGFVVAFGKGITPGSLLSSPTTRTSGLVANVDIAPTIAERYGAAIPNAAGQPLRADKSANAWRTLAALDRSHNAAARATTPVLAGYGVFAGVVCLFALWASGGESARTRNAARFGLLTAASVLPALLPVGIVAPQTAIGYGATLAAIALGVAGLATLASARLPPNYRGDALMLVLGLLVALVCADLLLSTRLVESSLLSGATLTGIRFYGIGNEWLGLLVGAAVAIRAPWYVGMVVVCAAGLPFFGADAGGTLAATTALTVLHFSKSKKQLKKRHVAGAFAFAVVVTLGFALLDRFLPDAARSHVGAAVATGQGADGITAIAAIALRKVALNAGLLLKPWTWLALAAIAAVGFGLTKRLPATGSLSRSILPAALCGATVALLFNDGGVAAGLLLLLPVIVRFLYDSATNETPATVLS